MNNRYIWLAILITSIMLQSCTLSYYQRRGFKIKEGIKNGSSTKLKDTYHFEYFFTIEAKPRQYTRIPTYNEERLKEDIAKYIKATQEIFLKNGFTANRINNEYKANFKIKVLMSPLWSATGHDMITGLSLGLIPTWGIKWKEYTYTFEDMLLKKECIYEIDEKYYNHLILFPVFWVSLINLNKINAYKASLTNFLEESQLNKNVH